MEYEYNECAATGSSIHLRGDRKKDSPLVLLLQMKMTIASSVYIAAATSSRRYSYYTHS